MLHTINISTHVIAGIIGMIIAIFAYSYKKGGKRHAQSGRLFLYAMGVVVLTALIGVLFYRSRPFLAVITFVSFYSAYSGYRVLKTRKTGFQLIDLAVMGMVSLVAIVFVVNLHKTQLVWNPAVIYYTLFSMFVLITFDVIRYFKPTLIRNPYFWLYDHTYRMTAAFAALVSAGAGTVMGFWEGFLAVKEIIPASATTLWLIFCMFYFPKRVRKRMEREKLSV